jgi:hypothetical protein
VEVGVVGAVGVLEQHVGGTRARTS